MNQKRRYTDERLYIAGPEVFYTGGFTVLDAMRRKAEYYGFTVTLPNDRQLGLGNEDLRLNADAIFANCSRAMNESTAIIMDLEQFRGSEPDGGTIYELGMAWARGMRCYGYSRDLRETVYKHQGARLSDGKVVDEEGRELAYADLPFAPSIMGSAILVQGDFDDCLERMMRDIDRERVLKGMAAALCDPEKKCSGAAAATKENPGKIKQPVVYLAGPERFAPDAAARYAAMKALCLEHGLGALSPLDPLPGEASIATDDPFVRAGMLFARYASHVQACDIIIANLEDFHGWEPNADVSFECGMAWQLGKTCIGHMPDTRIMRDRIPHYGPEKNNKDIYGNDVENFSYPINLMFSSSMPVVEGNFETALKEVLRIITPKSK